MKNPINYYRAKLNYKEARFPNNPVNVPTLMVWGVKDTALSKETAAMSARYFKDFTLKYIEDAGHWVQMEAPEQVIKYIKHFLEWKGIE